MTHEHEHEHEDDEHHHGGERHFYGVLPVFLVDDVVEAAEFYRDSLGFEVNFIYGEPASYASVSRDDAIINFSLSDPPGRRNSVSATGPGNGVDAYIVVSDVDDVYEEVTHHGASTLGAPQTHEYGMREFIIEDINGYRLTVGEEVEDEDDEHDHDHDDDEDDEP